MFAPPATVRSATPKKARIIPTTTIGRGNSCRKMISKTGTSKNAEFSMNEAVADSVSLRPFISNTITTVYVAPKTIPSRKIRLLILRSFLKKSAIRTRKARTNLTASRFSGSSERIESLEITNDVLRAMMTAAIKISYLFNFPDFSISILFCVKIFSPADF